MYRAHDRNHRQESHLSFLDNNRTLAPVEYFLNLSFEALRGCWSWRHVAPIHPQVMVNGGLSVTPPPQRIHTHGTPHQTSHQRMDRKSVHRPCAGFRSRCRDQLDDGWHFIRVVYLRKGKVLYTSHGALRLGELRDSWNIYIWW